MKQKSILDIHATSNRLQVFLFNVGQGDHILLKFPTGEYGIIDFFYDCSNNISEPPILSYFKELKKALGNSEFSKVTISFLCISHTDKDHVKGVNETIKWFYENGVFIKDIWLGGAKDESEFTDYLTVQLKTIIDTKMDLADKLKYSANIELLNSNLKEFFHYFSLWKNKEFNSIRYKTEFSAKGEYLVNIRQIAQPCSMADCETLVLGPLDFQLENFVKGINIEVVKKILGIKMKNGTVDKNHISHILRIKFGKSKLLFGGDTHKDVWEECLARYESKEYPYRKLHGKNSSHFIKVSHHGSKHSSSKEVWKKIISKTGKVFLGISAGRHRGFRHPHSETMDDIRSIRQDAQILSTNICHKCVSHDQFEKEIHSWYDDMVLFNTGRSGLTHDIVDEYINDEFVKLTGSIEEDEISAKPGLFAYILEISTNPKEDIKLRIALCSTIKAQQCFFEEHTHKLSANCL